MESLINLLPAVLIALLCPLMMIFMMRGMHGGHGAHNEHAAEHTAGEDTSEVAHLRAEVAALRRQVGERDEVA